MCIISLSRDQNSLKFIVQFYCSFIGFSDLMFFHANSEIQNLNVEKSLYSTNVNTGISYLIDQQVQQTKSAIQSVISNNQNLKPLNEMVFLLFLITIIVTCIRLGSLILAYLTLILATIFLMLAIFNALVIQLMVSTSVKNIVNSYRINMADDLDFLKNNSEIAMTQAGFQIGVSMSAPDWLIFKRWRLGWPRVSPSQYYFENLSQKYTPMKTSDNNGVAKEIKCIFMNPISCQSYLVAYIILTLCKIIRKMTLYSNFLNIV